MAQKILVLDDEENYAEMLESLLEQHLFIVDSATKPELALKALEEKGYDLVISDYKMPVMDGADFLQKAREINPDLPFIIVSGLMNTPELVKVANMGVTLVLEKPIDIENFIAQVKHFVEPVSEEEYARSRKAEEGTHAPVADGRKFIKTYPSDCKHVSDSSLLMQFFLQDLWDSVQEQNHVFVRTPVGAEAELLLAEVNRWKDAGEVPSLLLSAGSPVGAALASLKAYCQREKRAPIIGVTGFAGASMESQASLVDVIREASEEFTFLYFIDAPLLLKEKPPINEELYELIQESLCDFPPLSLRPSDLAHYLLRYLPRVAAAEGQTPLQGFSPEAVKVLLEHTWPGNFSELLSVLRVCVNRQSGGPLSGEIVGSVLAISEEGETPLLEKRLRQAQGSFLSMALIENGGSLAGLLESSSLDYPGINGQDSPESLPLLFPDLANSTD